MTHSLVDLLSASLKGKPRGDWMRRRELKAATGMSDVKLAEAIELGVRDGLIECEYLPHRDVTGRVVRMPHYRVKGKR